MVAATKKMYKCKRKISISLFNFLNGNNACELLLQIITCLTQLRIFQLDFTIDALLIYCERNIHAAFWLQYSFFFQSISRFPAKWNIFTLKLLSLEECRKWNGKIYRKRVIAYRRKKRAFNSIDLIISWWQQWVQRKEENIGLVIKSFVRIFNFISSMKKENDIIKRTKLWTLIICYHESAWVSSNDCSSIFVFFYLSIYFLSTNQLKCFF